MNAPVRPALRSKKDVLRALVDEISMPPHMDEKARGRYRSIGDWLNRDASTLKFLDPRISAQGSFMLGTVIRPVGDRDAYDVDLVCRLAKAAMAMFTQAGLKAAVGVEIRSYVQAHNMASAHREAHAAAFGVSHRVRQQVHQDLAQPPLVRMRPLGRLSRHVEHEIQALLMRLALEDRRHLLQHFAQTHLAAIEFKPPGLDLGDVEHPRIVAIKDSHPD